LTEEGQTVQSQFATGAHVRKLLFLDFDGVLHPTSASSGLLFCRVPLLQQALADHCCTIVISSSWRHHHSAEQLLALFPSTLGARIVGFTGEYYVGRWPRYQEIQNYRMANGNPNWRALDDSYLEFPKACPELLLCDPNVGLGAAQAMALSKWLTG